MRVVARKRFGQHFLSDSQVISRIIQVLAIKPGQHWVEIGPGVGALTKPILKQASRLDVIEIDRDLAPKIAAWNQSDCQLNVHLADALKVQLSDLAEPGEKLKLAGNLPYNISTPLLFHLLGQLDHIDEMYFMLQKEVVDRICAAPGNKTYGRLSVMIQAYCEADFLFEVAPNAFQPPPKVDSAVLRLRPREKNLLGQVNAKIFSQLVLQAFQQRRKTLSNAIRKFLSADEIRSTGIDPGCRAETLGAADFVRLAASVVEE